MPSKVHASKKSIVTMPYTPSLIQTILSVPELRRFLLPQQLADYTAGGEFRPAPKTAIRLFSVDSIYPPPPKCNRKLQNSYKQKLLFEFR